MMNATMARARRLGVLTPSVNTVFEPETMRRLPADGSVTAHFSRVRMQEPNPEKTARIQFDARGITESATLLADAEMDMIIWSGTAAGWLGFERDIGLVDAITAATGVMALTAVIALNQRLAMLGAQKIGLITPYGAAIEDSVIENYAGIGISVSASERLDLASEREFASVNPALLATLAQRIAATRPDAVVILGTNLAGARIADRVTRSSHVPVLDSAAVVLDGAIAALKPAPVPA